MRNTRLWIVVFGVLLTMSPADAQTNSSIAGTVRDTSGAVLPGVVIEARSPALIERVRSVVSDESGQYRIIELRPGVYTVTFTLPGFAALKREGIELTTGFSATVNAELRVGEVSETITVSGSSPIVDVKNVTQQQVMTRDIIDDMPTAKHFANLAMLITGAARATRARGRGGAVSGGTVELSRSSRSGAVAVEKFQSMTTLLDFWNAKDDQEAKLRQKADFIVSVEAIQ